MLFYILLDIFHKEDKIRRASFGGLRVEPEKTAVILHNPQPRI